MTIYVSLAVIGLTILIFLLVVLLRRGKKRRAILICGPSDSGKTVLFSQLVHGKQVGYYFIRNFKKMNVFENISL